MLGGCGKGTRTHGLTTLTSYWKFNLFWKHHCHDNSLLPFHQLLCTMLSSLTWNFVCQLLQISNVLRILLLLSSLIIYMAQLFVLLGEKVLKILVSLRLENRGLLASILGRRYKRTATDWWSSENRLGGNRAGSPVTTSSNPSQHQWELLQNSRGRLSLWKET